MVNSLCNRFTGSAYFDTQKRQIVITDFDCKSGSKCRCTFETVIKKAYEAEHEIGDVYKITNRLQMEGITKPYFYAKLIGFNSDNKPVFQDGNKYFEINEWHFIEPLKSEAEHE